MAAKCLDQVGDASDFVIVFNAGLWEHAEEPSTRLTLAHLVAHELAHPMLDRARHVSGVMDGVLIPSVTGLETAASMARIIAGEYRADRLADEIVSQYITASVDGDTRPAFVWLSDAPFYRQNLEDVLGAAHPLWADTVQEYREWRMCLEQMFGAIASSVDQTMTAIVHAQASADSAGPGTDLLSEEALASLPAVRLYLADTWGHFLIALREGPQLSGLSDLRETDERVTSIGRDAILEVWRRLGLTVLDQGDRRWGLEVAAPLR